MKSVKEEILSNLKLVKSMVEEGSTDKKIAEKLEVSISTWKKYKAECEEIKSIIAEAKDNKIQEVEEALYKCCTGYHYTEEVLTKVKEEHKNEDGTTSIIEDVKISKVKKYSKPELAAQKYYLNNRNSTKWKDDLHKVKNDKALLKLKEREIKSKEISFE